MPKFFFEKTIKKYAVKKNRQKSKSQHYALNVFFKNFRFGNYFEKMKIGHF